MANQKIAHSEPSEETLFEGRRAVIASAGDIVLGILSLGIWFLVSFLQAIARRYRITTRRIVIESGIFSKRLEQVDLYRINDYTVDRPFLQRIVGTGNLLLRTFDKTTPDLALTGIKTDVVALYERLRTATESDKQRRGVRMIDYE